MRRRAAAGASAAAQPATASASRTLYATTDQNRLLRFDARDPAPYATKAITNLPDGVTLQGIDFRPRTGELYGVGSNGVVYRVNLDTGIAVAEDPGAPAATLDGQSFGVDVNPAVDKIRVVSDAGQNLRLNIDEGTVLSVDRKINPGMPQVDASAYMNSGFSANPAPTTTLFAIDAASDQIFTQVPPNDGTLSNGKRLGIDVGTDAAFDIAGRDNVGYLSTAGRRNRSTLYRVNPSTGATRRVGTIGSGRLAITGLAAVQDVVANPAPTPTPSPTPSPAPSASPSPTRRRTRRHAPSASPSPTPTPSPSPTADPTPTPAP